MTQRERKLTFGTCCSLPDNIATMKAQLKILEDYASSAARSETAAVVALYKAARELGFDITKYLPTEEAPPQESAPQASAFIAEVSTGDVARALFAQAFPMGADEDSIMPATQYTICDAGVCTHARLETSPGLDDSSLVGSYHWDGGDDDSDSVVPQPNASTRDEQRAGSGIVPGEPKSLESATAGDLIDSESVAGAYVRKLCDSRGCSKLQHAVQRR